jgi:methionyl aminopeptidase
VIDIKSNKEIELMRKACRVVAIAHAEAAKVVKAGVSTYEIDKVVEKVILQHNARPSFKGYENG